MWCATQRGSTAPKVGTSNELSVGRKGRNRAGDHAQKGTGASHEEDVVHPISVIDAKEILLPHKHILFTCMHSVHISISEHIKMYTCTQTYIHKNTQTHMHTCTHTYTGKGTSRMKREREEQRGQKLHEEDTELKKEWRRERNVREEVVRPMVEEVAEEYCCRRNALSSARWRSVSNCSSMARISCTWACSLELSLHETRHKQQSW